MIKPKPLIKGDKIAVVSLSSGELGNEDKKHLLDIALKRLEDLGLIPVIMPYALKSDKYLERHPEKRAEDLKKAFVDPSIKGVINAIGGFDTYKTIPYLMEDKEFITALKNHPKIFTGFSDTTNNHLMFSHLGLVTFYGPSLLVDLGELDKDMLPYTRKYFLKYFKQEKTFTINSSKVWYKERKSYDKKYINTPRIRVKEKHGYECINGKGRVKGYLYGGCLQSLYDIYTGANYKDEPNVYEKYQILPTNKEWQEKILFLETSERKATPKKLKIMLQELKNQGILKLVKGVLVGKPVDEVYYEAYKKVYQEVFKDLDTPILYNINFGHTHPRCILPYGIETIVDFDKKTIKINEPIFNDK